MWTLAVLLLGLALLVQCGSLQPWSAGEHGLSSGAGRPLSPVDSPVRARRAADPRGGDSADRFQPVTSCVADFNCFCTWDASSAAGGNITEYEQVLCQGNGLGDLAPLMDAVPRTGRILLTCWGYDGRLNLTANASVKHATSLRHLQFTKCSVGMAPDAFSQLSSLREVDLFYTSVPRWDLQALGNLGRSEEGVVVRLSAGEVPALPDFAFGEAPGKNITDLSLAFNNIGTVSPQAFAGMDRLRKLFLNNNDLTVLKNGTLDGCEELQVLRLQHNGIELVEGALVLPWLLDMDLSWNRLTALDADTFKWLGRLQYLNMSHNAITSLPVGIFDGLASLRALRLEWNSLLSLDPLAAGGAASPWTQLTLLNVSHNALQEDTPFLLQSRMAGLSAVDFSHNALRTLRRGAVTGLHSLLEVDLKNNSLSSMEWEAVADLPKVQRVDFSLNEFTEAPADFLFYYSPLQQRDPPLRLYMAGNPLSCGCDWPLLIRLSDFGDFGPVLLADFEEWTCRAPAPVHGRAYAQLPADEFLCPLEPCVVPECDCYNRTADRAVIIACQGRSRTVCDPVALPAATVSFECRGCLAPDCSALPPASFAGLERLETLTVDGNDNLTAVSPGTFADLSGLRSLALGNNRLTEISSSETASLRSLTAADFHNNRLTRLDADLFASSANLSRVDLSGNDLVSLPEGIFNFTGELRSVRFSGNSLVCNCSLLWLKHWMQEHFEAVEEIGEVRCTVNQTDEQVPVVEVPDGDFGCGNGNEVTKVVVHGVIVAAVFGLVAVILALIMAAVRYRRPARVLLYTRLGLRFAAPGKEGEEEGDEDGMLYDAYLAYSDANIDQALQQVRPRLEDRRPPYALCFRHRDFPVGAARSSAIVESVNASRRTLLFLGPEFLASEWCLFEFQAAHARCLSEQVDRIVPVVVGQVPEDSLPEDLRLYMASNRCLRMADPLFWDKLCYAMPRQRARPKGNEELPEGN